VETLRKMQQAAGRRRPRTFILIYLYVIHASEEGRRAVSFDELKYPFLIIYFKSILIYTTGEYFP
jgi:hypothetical protein